VIVKKEDADVFRKSGAALSDAAFEAALFAEEDYVYRISFIYMKRRRQRLRTSKRSRTGHGMGERVYGMLRILRHG